MVYESDYYTSRRPYSRPTMTTYTITRLGDHYDWESPYSWPVRREFSRILSRPRPHPGIVYTERFLNSRPLTYFDDETKWIRAKAGALLRKVYTPVPRATIIHKPYEVYSTLMDYNIYPSSLPKNVYNMSYYKDPAKVSIGRGHLACVEFAGGRGYPRRRHLFGDENRNIRDEIKFRSYYRRSPTGRAAEDAALPTGFASKLLHLPLKIRDQSPYKIHRTHARSVPPQSTQEEDYVPTTKIKDQGFSTKYKKEYEPKIREKSPEIKKDEVQQEVTVNIKKKSPKKHSVPKVETLTDDISLNTSLKTPEVSEDIKLDYSIKLPRRSKSKEASPAREEGPIEVVSVKLHEGSSSPRKSASPKTASPNTLSPRAISPVADDSYKANEDLNVASENDPVETMINEVKDEDLLTSPQLNLSRQNSTDANDEIFEDKEIKVEESSDNTFPEEKSELNFGTTNDNIVDTPIEEPDVELPEEEPVDEPKQESISILEEKEQEDQQVVECETLEVELSKDESIDVGESIINENEVEHSGCEEEGALQDEAIERESGVLESEDRLESSENLTVAELSQGLSETITGGISPEVLENEIQDESEVVEKEANPVECEVNGGNEEEDDEDEEGDDE